MGNTSELVKEDKILIRGLTFGGVNYGDVVSYKEYRALLDQLDANDKEIKVLKDEVLVHAKDSTDCSSAYRKLKARNTLLEKVVEAARELKGGLYAFGASITLSDDIIMLADNLDESLQQLKQSESDASVQSDESLEQ